jgi:nitrous oxidase accessory protein NosD
MRTFTVILAVLLAGLACRAAHAQSCGTALTASLTLTADLDCRGEPFALKIDADGVTINLNGRRILGTGGTAIVASGRHRLTVRGPGRIEHFHIGIDAMRSDHLTVSGVEFVNVSEAGIALTHSYDAKLQQNRFRGFAELAAIDIRQPLAGAGYPAGGHQILDNIFDNLFVGIGACGADAGGNLILGNTFSRIFEHALLIRDEAGYNSIQSNKFRDYGAVVTLISTADNTLYSNAWEGGGAAIRMLELPAAGCVTRSAGIPRAERNRILHNWFYATTHPIAIDAGRLNRLSGNSVRGAVVGMTFGKPTRDNDARGNVYPGTTTWVRDFGVGNLWP